MVEMFDPEMIERLKSAERCAVLTGAGISAESGVPTYRDAQTGLWSTTNPEDMDTRAGFLRNPVKVWRWYAWRRKLMGAAKPNPGHFALARLESFFPVFHLITQNIDGLHQQAGSKNVIELHGNVWKTRCLDNGHMVGYDPPEEITEVPVCPQCGSYLRPGVVWFGEALPEDALDAAFEAAQRSQVFIVAGTSGAVQPAASLPIIARQSAAMVIEVNPVESEVSYAANYVLKGKAGEILPGLLQALHLA
jgi:NAD-dependent deacetylase